MVGFIFKNDFFEFDNQTKQQIFKANKGTKGAPTNAGIFIGEVEPLGETDK